MAVSKIISDSKLDKYLHGNSKVQKVEALLKEQIDSWALASKNYKDISSIKKKEFNFDAFKIILQFNPGRMISSSAKVDLKSINERPCFLCPHHLPVEQSGLQCNDNYLLLVNPFPIFDEHFTIPLFNHEPQQIHQNFADMLLIVKELGEKYTLFYNGPKCGASAPDHMHFQASPKNEMPVEREMNTLLKSAKVLSTNNTTSVYAVSKYLRDLFLIESNDINSVKEEFNKLYNSIQNVFKVNDEPLLNVIITFEKVWRVFVFPRKAHRAKEFFLEGDEKVLLSPASVDFGGLLITPRKKDFDKITKENIINLFQQTSVDEIMFQEIIEKFESS